MNQATISPARGGRAGLLSLVVIMFFNSFCQVKAAVINANSPSRTDVGAAVAAALDGDVVRIPAGTADWTSTLWVNKAITIQGAGIGQTIITDSIHNPDGKKSNDAVFAFLTASNKTYRLTGVEVVFGAPSSLDSGGAIQFWGTSQTIRIDHSRFTYLPQAAIEICDYVNGVVDHCSFVLSNRNFAVQVWQNAWGNEDEDYGDGSWCSPANLGTANALYVEDCFMTYIVTPSVGYYAAIDSEAGSRYVFRYNVLTNLTISAHGTESSSRQRSTRSVEIYMNQIYEDQSYVPRAIELRGGTGVVWSNTVLGVGFTHLCDLSAYRLSAPYFAWGQADGKNAWDYNETGPITNFTYSGTNGSRALVVSGANWTVNQWQGYSFQNTNSHKVTICDTNTADTAFMDGQSGWFLLTNGDYLVVYKVRYVLDMPGMGQGDDLKASYPAAPVAWPHQQIEPLYGWGNVGTSDNKITTTAPGVIVEGTHFFNNTPKPGYTPYTYPHPLTMEKVVTNRVFLIH